MEAQSQTIQDALDAVPSHEELDAQVQKMSRTLTHFCTEDDQAEFRQALSRVEGFSALMAVEFNDLESARAFKLDAGTAAEIEKLVASGSDFLHSFFAQAQSEPLPSN